MKIDTGFSIKEGLWETYGDTPKAPPHLLLRFLGSSQNSSTSLNLENGSHYES